MILDYGLEALSNPFFIVILVVVGFTMWFSMKGLEKLLFHKKIETFCKGCNIPLIGVQWCKKCWAIKCECEIKERGDKS